MIGLIGWAAIIALHIAADLYLRRFRLDIDDNLLARKHNTQVRVLARTIDVLLVMLTLSAALMTFPAVRQYGVSLFASAGVAGIVAGLAARPVLSNLMAGVQLAMTQPIRLYDAVIVENEYGTIEEITSTYVVVKLWDLRRMIVPLTYFIEKPFQNWTRESSSLDRQRDDLSRLQRAGRHHPREIQAISQGIGKWDGKMCRRCRSRISRKAQWSCAADERPLVAEQTFDLRCEVREKLIEFLQHEHPDALPHSRQISLQERTGSRCRRRKTLGSRKTAGER